jgi:TRAP-type mannitol/chloroaromatic compound transport system substrate-binding protein
MSMGELMFNLEKWNGLSDGQREILKAVCKESMLRGFAQGEAIQFPALQELESKGVQIHRWSPEILGALEAAWNEVVVEEAAENEDFARVWKSLSEFRKNYKIWGDMGYLD